MESAVQRSVRNPLSFEDVLVSQLVQEGAGAMVRHDEQRFRELIDRLPAAVYTTDADGRITHFNKACIEFSGRTPELGRDHWCVTWRLQRADGAPLPHDQCPMAIALKEGRAIRGAEAIAHRPDGSSVWFTPYPTPIKDADGVVVGGINMLVDISERKRSEQAERRRASQLAAFMETAAIGLHRGSGDGRILWANEAEARLLGYTVEEYTRLNVLEIHAEPAIATDALARLMRGEKLREYETRLRCRDGSIRHVLIHATALFEDGHFVHTQSLTIDITDRKHSHALLHQQAQDLSELHRRKDEFLAMLSHELRNPLAPIINAVHVLGREASGLNRASQQACGIIQRQVGQLSHLVDDLLEVSRITSGRIQLRPETVALSAVVDRAVEACRPQISGRHHELLVSLPTEPVWLHADPVRLEQILVNLLSNATKYTDRGGQIRVLAKVVGSELVLKIKDNGIGIPAEFLPHIFELFTQSDRSLDRAQGGLGIGLALVHRLIEMHGGTIEVRSEVAKGSEFTVRLPVSAAPRLERPARAPVAGRLHRILVVDDNRDAAESLAMVVGLEGHQVRTAYGSETAVEVARQFLPTVVILDIGLPVMNGYELMRRLREEKPLARATYVAFTGYGDERDRLRSQAAGFEFHLTKPAPSADLQAILARIP